MDLKPFSRVLLLAISFVAFQAQAATVRVCLPAYREELTTLLLMQAQDMKAFDPTIKLEFKTMGPDERKEYVLKDSPTPELAFHDNGVAEAVSKGGCDFGVSVVDHFFTAPAAELQNTKPLMVTSYGKDYDTHIVTAKDSKIQSIKDLKGKRVRMGQIPNGLAMDGVLREAGLSLKDIQQVHQVPVTEVLAKLEKHELDAAITYAPTMPYMLASGKVRVLKGNLLSGLTGRGLPHSMIIVNKGFQSKNSAMVVSVMKGLHAAHAHFQRNPSDLVRVFAKHSNELRMGDWKVDPVVAERSGSFMGTMSVVDLTDKNAQLVQDIRAYSAKLESAKYIPKANDLTAWL